MKSSRSSQLNKLEVARTLEPHPDCEIKLGSTFGPASKAKTVTRIGS